MEEEPIVLKYRRTPNIIFAGCMIVAGLLLFLANLGLFSIHRVWELWPLIFTVVGFSRLANRRKACSQMAAIAYIVIGILATLFSTGLFQLRLHDDSWPIALLLIFLGVTGLARALDGDPWTFKRARRPSVQWQFSDTGEAPSSDSYLSHHTIMGNIKRRVESQNFRGGKLSTTMGNIKLDLRRAKMPDGQRSAHLEVHSMMGNVTLRIPETWSIQWMGENVMGNFHDKSIPPNTGPDAPRLIVTGSCTMGQIEIEN